MTALGYPLYVNGRLLEEPVTISHVPPNAVGASDRDPSFGGLGRSSALGQYVQYHANLGENSALPEPSGWMRLAAVVGPVFAGLGIYHGYRRNDSVGWAIGWGLMTAAFPVIMIPIALAQGFGKPKAMRANRSRRRRRAKARAPRRRAKRRSNRRRIRKGSYVGDLNKVSGQIWAYHDRMGYRGRTGYSSERKAREAAQRAADRTGDVFVIFSERTPAQQQRVEPRSG